MLKKTTILSLALGLALTGCGKKPLNVLTRKTTELLKQVYHDYVFNVFAQRVFPSIIRVGLSKAELDKKMEEVRISLYKEVPALDESKTDCAVSSVITTNTDKETGSHTCKAKLKSVNKQTSENNR